MKKSEGNYKKGEKMSGFEGDKNKKFKNNKKRLGGKNGGLSLQAFANAKSMNDGYNPALIKKQREFYKNAKCVNKYKKLQKQPNQGEGSSQVTKSIEGRIESAEVGETSEGKNNLQGRSESTEAGKTPQGKRKNGKKIAYSLNEIYNKKREESDKVRMEKEAIINAKKEVIDKSKARRKAQRENMFKRTKSGQPIMKYRIEHLLQTIQGSNY